MPMARHAASRHGKESGDGYQNNKFDEVDWQINDQTCAVLQSLAEASTVLEGKKHGSSAEFSPCHTRYYRNGTGMEFCGYPPEPESPTDTRNRNRNPSSNSGSVA